jgi:hypothetical protein
LFESLLSLSLALDVNFPAFACELDNTSSGSESLEVLLAFALDGETIDKGEDGSMKATWGDACCGSGATIEMEIGDLEGDMAALVAVVVSGEVGGSTPGVGGTFVFPCNTSLTVLILETHSSISAAVSAWK